MTVLRPPVSKSDAQRALVLADIVGVPFDSVLSPDEVLPRDIKVLRAGLEALARGGTCDIDCHDGGAPFRFLLTQAAILPGRLVRFTGTPRLGERPHGPLVEALRAALGPFGLAIEEGSPWPLVVRSATRLPLGGGFSVTGVESSQFASSLLLGAARVAFITNQPCSVRVNGALTSEGYLELTREWGRRAGFTLVDAADGTSTVTRGTHTPQLQVPGDWSSLTYLLALAWKSGAEVERVDFDAVHPDKEIVRLLESVGLTISRGPLVRVTGQATRGFEVDAQVCPDAVPTLAAIAAILPGPTTVTRVGILRHKESDRLAATRALLDAAGASSQLDGERLTISPGPLHDFAFDAHDDHRMAMSAAVLSVLGEVKLSLTGREAVAKSFPQFWGEFAKVVSSS